jgi:hypothetical protein
MFSDSDGQMNINMNGNVHNQHHGHDEKDQDLIVLQAEQESLSEPPLLEQFESEFARRNNTTNNTHNRRGDGSQSQDATHEKRYTRSSNSHTAGAATASDSINSTSTAPFVVDQPSTSTSTATAPHPRNPLPLSSGANFETEPPAWEPKPITNMAPPAAQYSKELRQGSSQPLEECESAENAIDAIVEAVLGAAAASAAAPPVVAVSARASPSSLSSSSLSSSSSFPSRDYPPTAAVDADAAAIAIAPAAGDYHYEVDHQEESSHKEAPPQLEHEQQLQAQAQAQSAREATTTDNNSSNTSNTNSNNKVYEDTRSTCRLVKSFSPSTMDNTGTSAAWGMEEMKSTLKDTLDENEDLLKDLQHMIATCDTLESERSNALDENAQRREHAQLLLKQIQELQPPLSESEQQHYEHDGTALQGMSPPPNDEDDTIDHNSTQLLNKLVKDNRQLLQERATLRMELNEKLREDLANKETFQKAQAAWQRKHLHIKDTVAQQQQEIISLKEQKMISQEERQKQRKKKKKRRSDEKKNEAVMVARL